MQVRILSAQRRTSGRAQIVFTAPLVPSPYHLVGTTLDRRSRGSGRLTTGTSCRMVLFCVACDETNNCYRDTDEVDCVGEDTAPGTSWTTGLH